MKSLIGSHKPIYKPSPHGVGLFSGKQQLTRVAIARRKPHVLTAFVLSFSLLKSSKAQFELDMTQKNGISSYQSYKGGQVDAINMMNGALALRIPLFSLPQKGKLSLSFSLQLTSSPWQEHTEISQTSDGSTGSERYILGAPLGVTIMLDQDKWVQSWQSSWYQYQGNGYVIRQYEQNGFLVRDPFGQTHMLMFNANNLSQLRSVDGEGYLFVPSHAKPFDPSTFSPGETDPAYFSTTQTPGTLFDPDGTKHVYSSSGQSITDPDSNTIAINPSQVITDTVGRTLTYGPAAEAYTTSTNGCPNLNVPNEQSIGSATWIVPSGDKTTAQYIFCYTSINLNTHFGFPHAETGATCSKNCYSTDQVTDSFKVLQSVVLPNGTYWGFIYDSVSTGSEASAYGNLTKLLFPDGGEIDYGYSVSARGTVYPNYSSIATKTLIASPGAVANTWTYNLPAYTQMGYGYQTSVLDPEGNETVIAFSDYTGRGNFHQNSRTAYSGKASDGTLVQRESDNYYVYSLSWALPGTGGVGNGSEVLPSTIQITHPGGAATTTSIIYDSGFSATGFGCEVTGGGYTTSCSKMTSTLSPDIGSASIFPFGKQKTITQTDYNGNVVRTENYNYLWEIKPDYLNSNFLNLVFSTSLSGPKGTESNVNNTFDESGYVANQGILGGHETTSNRAVSSSTSLSFHSQWSSSGLKIADVDPAGNTISLLYGSQYQGLYPTTITNAVGETSDISYLWNRGSVVKTKDANGQYFSQAYDDPLDRLTNVEAADGGVTSYVYNDSSYARSVKISRQLTASSGTSTKVDLDGFGRALDKTLQAPEGTIESDQSYDQIGRTYQVSDPYLQTSGSVSRHNKTKYFDALGRVIRAVNEDGTSESWCYDGVQDVVHPQANCQSNVSSVPSGTWVNHADERGSNSQTVFDYAGRLQAVVDPMGHETGYEYDARGNVLSVSQNGYSGEGNRQRTFAYDGLSRIISSSNAETGTKTYSYVNSSGNLCAGDPSVPCSSTDARNIVTSYRYDAVNRLVQKIEPIVVDANNSVNGAIATCYQYGASGSSATGNLVGRVVAQWTERWNQADVATGKQCEASYPASTAVLSATLFQSYDPNGRLLVSQQCVKNFCGSRKFMQSQTYDFFGNMTSWGDGRGVMTLKQQFDSAGRPTSVITTLLGSVLSPVLFSAQGYSPSGSIKNWNIGNLLNFTRSYDNRLRIETESVTH